MVGLGFSHPGVLVRIGTRQCRRRTEGAVRGQETEVTSGDVSQETGPQGAAAHTRRGIGVSPSARNSHSAPANARVSPRRFSGHPAGPSPRCQSRVLGGVSGAARSASTSASPTPLPSEPRAAATSRGRASPAGPSPACARAPTVHPAGLACGVFSATRIPTGL